MDIPTIVSYLGPIIAICIIPAIRSIYMRLQTLEAQVLNKVSDYQVRQLLEDKVDPIHQDLKEIKGQLSNIINRLIDSK